MRPRLETGDVLEDFGATRLRERGSVGDERWDRFGFNDAGIVSEMVHAGVPSMSDDVTPRVGGVGSEDRWVGSAPCARPRPEALPGRRREFTGMIPGDPGLADVLPYRWGARVVGIQTMGGKADGLGMGSVPRILCHGRVYQRIQETRIQYRKRR